MENINIYIKKLLALGLSILMSYLLTFYLEIYYIIPFSLLVLSFLVYRITGEKPDYLYGIANANDFLDQKGGFWLLFKLIFGLFAVIYDLILWTLNGVVIIFVLFADLLILIKNILFWILHAFIWFLKQFAPPFIFIYRISIYYFVRWPWWLYKLAFRNTAICLNRNYYFIALWGSVLSILLIGLFWGAGKLVGLPFTGIFGLAFAILPLIWSYTEIAALRHENRDKDSYGMVRIRFSRGTDAIKAVFIYLVVFILLFVLQIILYLVGMMPDMKMSILGILLNLNTIISLLLVILFVILIFSKILLPVHMVYNPDFGNNIMSVKEFLEVIGKKFIRYIISVIPGTVFAILLSIIPVFVVGLALLLTLELKNQVIEKKLDHLIQISQTAENNNGGMRREIQRLEYKKKFPLNIYNDFNSLREYKAQKEFLEEIIGNISLTESQKQIYNEKLSDINWMTRQLPVAFLFLIIWISLFGGLILAFIIAYFGNIYYELYLFREDNKPLYFEKVLTEINHKDRNQPLLGFTLICISLVVLWLFFSGYINGWK